MFTTTDPQGRPVELTTRSYTDHILVEHPDMSDVDEIELAIRMPEVIAQDAIDPERTVYYRTYQCRPQRWIHLAPNARPRNGQNKVKDMADDMLFQAR